MHKKNLCPIPYNLTTLTKTGLCMLTLPVLLLISGCSKTDDTSPAIYLREAVAYKTITGIDINLTSLDIYHFRDTATPVPVVAYVHGGAWMIGDKANSLSNKLDLFSSLGYVFVSINYRLSPVNNDLDPGRIMYPDHNNDVADAVKWIYDNIMNYGGDRQKVVIMGHSAGAHLVSLTGTSSEFLPARGLQLDSIRGVASIDTEGYDVAAQANAGVSYYLNAFGTDPLIWDEASPVNNLFQGTAYPAFFIAKRGLAQRIAIADGFITKLQSAGVAVSQVDGSVYDHEGINDAIGAPGETIITGPLKLFLSECFE